MTPRIPEVRVTDLRQERRTVSRDQFERRFYPQPPRYGKPLFGFAPFVHQALKATDLE